MDELLNAQRIMKNEKECVKRADTCGRDCAKCELVQDTDELIKAYDYAIAALGVIRNWEDTENDDGK